MAVRENLHLRRSTAQLHNKHMSPKSKSPIEVTLEKSSSGIWTVPEFPKRQLKPWQRLWVITGLIYILILGGSFYVLLPDRQSIEKRMVTSVIEEVKRYDGMAFAGESPRDIFESARSQGYTTWIALVRLKYRIGPEANADFDWIGKVYRDALSDLSAKRKLGLMICLVAWLMPMSVLYALGLVVDWIKRGTRGIQK